MRDDHEDVIDSGGCRCGTGHRRSLARRVVADPAGAATVSFVVIVAVVAVLAPWIAPYDPIRNDLSNTLAPPSGTHWMGTDELGRDVLSRLLVGARVSLLASVLAASVAVLIGLPLGLAAGYWGGRADRWIVTMSDAVQSLPGLILLLAVVAVFGKGVAPAMITLGVLLAPTILRIVRAAAVNVRHELFVDAARTIGLKDSTIVRRHVLPHVMPPLVVQASLSLGVALIVEAGLSFIGLGVQPPAPSWGAMLSRATSYVSHSPTLVFPAGLMITSTVLALNLLGDVVRDQMGADTQSRRRLAHRRRSPVPVGAPTTTPSDSILAVRDLHIAFPDDDGASVEVVTGVSFDVGRGETVGLVGESGCGKSVTARSLLGLVPAPGFVTGGSIRLAGLELVGATERTLRTVRGTRIGLVMQDPASSLDPSFTVGSQIAEAVRVQAGVSRKAAAQRAIELLDQVGIADAGRRVGAYPHEFSGGMAQRVLIAAALAGDPEVLVADEPTTALDVTVQVEILDLLRRLQAERAMSMVFVTHDLGVVADLCDRIVIMYAGQVVEEGDTAALFAEPSHPYMAALLGAILRNERYDGPLTTIPGSVPAPRDWPTGCRFAPRCPHAVAMCAEPVALSPSATGLVRCVRSNELIDQEVRR